MLVIKIELWPKGDERRKRTLHVGFITNTGKGTKTRGEYRVGLSKKLRGPRLTPWKEGVVNGFPRKRLGAWDLLYRALRDIVGDRR